MQVSKRGRGSCLRKNKRVDVAHGKRPKKKGKKMTRGKIITNCWEKKSYKPKEATIIDMKTGHGANLQTKILALEKKKEKKKESPSGGGLLKEIELKEGGPGKLKNTWIGKKKSRAFLSMLKGRSCYIFSPGEGKIWGGVRTLQAGKGEKGKNINAGIPKAKFLLGQSGGLNTMGSK